MSSTSSSRRDYPHHSPWASWLPWVLLIVAAFFLLRGRFTRPGEEGLDIRSASKPLIDPTFVNNNNSHLTLAAAKPRDIAIPAQLGEQEQATVALFRKCSQSTVFIRTQAEHQYNLRATQIAQGTGSGFVWDKEGRIVTNAHVIQRAQEVIVTLADQSEYLAKVLGADPSQDIALLQIDAPKDKLRPLPIGTSEDLMVGQSVFAIGNPFGLDQTLTTGVISGLERQIQSRSQNRIEGAIQTDAAINPGNSGGPLLDSSGRLIGVNTAIFSPSGAYAGVGFAIPVDTVNRVVPQLIQRRYDQETRPWFGVALAPKNSFWGQALQEDEIAGVLVLAVEPGSTAEAAGVRATISRGNLVMQLGDIITEVNDEPVKSREDLLDFLARHKIGDRVTIGVLRVTGRDENELKMKQLTLKAKLKPLVD